MFWKCHDVSFNRTCKLKLMDETKLRLSFKLSPSLTHQDGTLGQMRCPVTTLFLIDKPWITYGEKMAWKWFISPLISCIYRSTLGRCTIPWQHCFQLTSRALSRDNTVSSWQALNYLWGENGVEMVYFPLISCISTGPWNWNFSFPIWISQIYPLYADSESPSCTFSDMP